VHADAHAQRPGRVLARQQLRQRASGLHRRQRIFKRGQHAFRDGLTRAPPNLRMASCPARESDRESFQTLWFRQFLVSDRFGRDRWKRAIRKFGGALVKTVSEGVLASFEDSLAAVETACAVAGVADEPRHDPALRVRVGVHRGPAMMTTFNDQSRLLRYDGQGDGPTGATRCGRRGLGEPGGRGDPQVAAWLRARRLQGQVVAARLPELPNELVHRIRGSDVSAD